MSILQKKIMVTEIRCQNCGNTISIEEAVAEDYKKSLREEMIRFKKEKEEQFKKEQERLREKEEQLAKKLREEEENLKKLLEQERTKIKLGLEEDIRKSIAADYENKLLALRRQQEDASEKLKEFRKKELEFLQKEIEMQNKTAQLELEFNKKLLEERVQLAEQIRRQENERIAQKELEYQLKMKELEKQLEDQKKLAEEMQRKAEQGSMQLQGEVQELMLEEILAAQFPGDTVEEVGKGVEGADCILTVRNRTGQECGKIIFESKRTRNWNAAWLEKLKKDMRATNSHIAVLVSKVYPKNMNCFGEVEGIWVCNFNEVAALTSALRNAIIMVYESKKAEENKGEKMQMLYNYLTGPEFRGQVEAIVEGFMAMKTALAKERIQMEKIWKEREKQIDKVLLSTSSMYGAVKGIAGSSVNNIPLLEPGEDDENTDEAKED